MKLKDRRWIPTMLPVAMIWLLAMNCLLAASAGAQVKNPTITSGAENSLTPATQPFRYTSREGDFRVTMPGGCSSVMSRTPQDVGSADAEYPVMVYCDRNGEKGEGCSVTALFNVHGLDGGPVGPTEVTVRMGNMLREFGAEIKKQVPLKRDFGNGLVAEGLDVFASQTGGSGQVWLRGMLVDGIVYIMGAWDLEGGLWDNPEYATFFNSFLPGTE